MTSSGKRWSAFWGSVGGLRRRRRRWCDCARRHSGLGRRGGRGRRLDRDCVASYRTLNAELEEAGKELWLRAAENRGRIVHRAMKKLANKKR